MSIFGVTTHLLGMKELATSGFQELGIRRRLGSALLPSVPYLCYNADVFSRCGEWSMAVTIEAVYENGVLKPSQPLPWKEGERVRIAVSSLDSPILKAYGIMGFQGTAEEAEYFALDPELLPEESR